jgi:hypothetical protein
MATNTFKSKKQRNVGTSLVAVGAYVVPAATTATVIGLSICNTTNNVIQVSATQNDGTNDYYIIKNVTLVVGGSVAIAGGDQKLVLVTGESIKVVSSAATSVDVVMTILESA